MVGGGFQKARGDLARGSDPLPTAKAVALAKESALYWVTLDIRQAAAWPPSQIAHEMLDMVPLVALDALQVACPDVRAGATARALGLGPNALAELVNARARPCWPSVAVAHVVRALTEAQP